MAGAEPIDGQSPFDIGAYSFVAVVPEPDSSRRNNKAQLRWGSATCQSHVPSLHHELQ